MLIPLDKSSTSSSRHPFDSEILCQNKNNPRNKKISSYKVPLNRQKSKLWQLTKMKTIGLTYPQQ
jgi:hypothetical protein